VSGPDTKPHVRAGWLNASAYTGMFGFGVVMALLGSVLPLLSARLHFDLAQAGNLFFAMNAAMLATTLALGPCLDRFGHKWPLAGAPLFVSGALALIANANQLEGVVAAVVLLGIGGGALNQTTNTLVADLSEGAHGKSVALNLLGVFFGFGALFVPFTMGSLVRALGLANILYMAAGVSLVPTVLSIRLSFPHPQQRGGVPLASILLLLRQPLVLIFSFLLFFESGSEFILGGYITTYLTRNLGATVSSASYLLAGYWGALMVARIVLSRTFLRQGGGKLIVGSALGVALSMVLLLTARSVSLAGAAILLLGFSIATIFPTVLGLAGASYAGHAGTVFGILIGIALSGGMTMPWLTGKLSEEYGIRRGLLIVIANALAVFALQLGAGRVMKSPPHFGDRF
jgi:fucose permease